jgi:hypothetical protein
MTRSRTGGGTGFAGAAEGIIHDGADRAGAAAALRAATEAAVNIDRFARTRIGRDAVTDLGVGKYVARANDHGHFPAGRLEFL